jgi:hypothetical protein
VAQGVGPEFKPQHCKKKKKRESNTQIERGLSNYKTLTQDNAVCLGGYGTPQILTKHRIDRVH